MYHAQPQKSATMYVLYVLYGMYVDRVHIMQSPSVLTYVHSVYIRNVVQAGCVGT